MDYTSYSKPSRSFNSSSLEHVKKIKFKVQELYTKKYSKLNAGSINNILCKSRFLDSPKYLKRSSKPKDKLTISLGHEHIPNSEGYKIIDLPKSPFGKHKPYNEEKDFIEKHFFISGSPKSTLNKKLSLLNKKVNKAKLRRSKKVQVKNDIDIFNTGGGFLFCRKNKSVMKIYEAEAEKFKRLNLHSYKDTGVVSFKKLTIKKDTLPLQSLSRINIRRFTPSPFGSHNLLL